MSLAFPFPLRLERTAPRKGVLIERFVFISLTRGWVEVEKGFDTDYASIPRIFWNIMPPDAEYTEAAVVHDRDYWYQEVEREVADLTLLQGMEALGVSFLRRQLIYRSVRAFGSIAWNANRRKKLAGIIA